MVWKPARVRITTGTLESKRNGHNEVVLKLCFEEKSFFASKILDVSIVAATVLQNDKWIKKYFTA